MVIKLIAISVGGVIGTLLRYFLSQGTHRLLGTGFPYGTLVVNVLGSFLIGLIATLAAQKYLFSSNIRDMLLIGGCGAFTTFSTFIFETIFLAKDRGVLFALLNISLSIILGVVFFWLGTVLAKVI